MRSHRFLAQNLLYISVVQFHRCFSARTSHQSFFSDHRADGPTQERVKRQEYYYYDNYNNEEYSNIPDDYQYGGDDFPTPTIESGTTDNPITTESIERATANNGVSTDNFPIATESFEGATASNEVSIATTDIPGDTGTPAEDLTAFSTPSIDDVDFVSTDETTVGTTDNFGGADFTTESPIFADFGDYDFEDVDSYYDFYDGDNYFDYSDSDYDGIDSFSFTDNFIDDIQEVFFPDLTEEEINRQNLNLPLQTIEEVIDEFPWIEEPFTGRFVLPNNQYIFYCAADIQAYMCTVGNRSGIIALQYLFWL